MNRHGDHMRSAQKGFTSCVRSAQKGFTSSLRSAQKGFTLVEMLVALSIFAVISAAGVLLLRASIDTQQAVTARLEQSSDIARLRALLSAELSSAQPRPHRSVDGAAGAAFVADGSAIRFVHAAGGSASRPGLMLVSYRLEGRQLLRQSSAALDGVALGGGSGAEAAVLLEDVTALAWRFRTLAGDWVANWQADDAARLPRAVELSVARAGAAPLVLRFLVAPDGLLPPGEGLET